MEQVKDYELRAFFNYVVNVLEQLNIPYMVVGGFAAIFYGEPRFTLDVDIVADVKLHHISELANMFPFPDYYLSEEGIRDSLIRRYPFNIIQPTTGAKVDIVPLPSDAFTHAAFKRRQRRIYDETGRTATNLKSINWRGCWLMQTIEELLMSADDALVKYRYYQRRERLHPGKGHVKFRIYLSRNIFVQVNRNEIANLTNMVLLQDFERIYARGEYHGK